MPASDAQRRYCFVSTCALLRTVDMPARGRHPTRRGAWGGVELHSASTATKLTAATIDSQGNTPRSSPDLGSEAPIVHGRSKRRVVALVLVRVSFGKRRQSAIKNV